MAIRMATLGTKEAVAIRPTPTSSRRLKNNKNKALHTSRIHEHSHTRKDKKKINPRKSYLELYNLIFPIAALTFRGSAGWWDGGLQSELKHKALCGKKQVQLRRERRATG